MRPRRPKQCCLQLVMYLFIHFHCIWFLWGRGNATGLASLYKSILKLPTRMLMYFQDESRWAKICRGCLLLPGISRQQTTFLIHLRFLVQWLDGSMVICDCSAVQSAVCLAAAPVFLLWATRHFVLLSRKICAEIVVYRMLAVFLNGLNGKNSSRRIVRNIFSVYFFLFRFQD